jgi:hypothetical protein
MFEPLRYDPSLEQVADDEAETIQELTRTLLKISETTFENGNEAIRSVHAKPHGIVQAQLTVLDHLPPHLAQGIFARPRSYPVVMRFSTSPGDLLPDAVSTPRGVAIKVIGVEGQRLPGSENDTTQEFLMVDSPAFLAPDAKHFVRSLKLLAATTDRVEGFKTILSSALRGAESLLEKSGHESGALKGLGGHPLTHILGASFFTQVPTRHGDYVAKLSLVPVSPALVALRDTKLPLKDQPDGLRQAVSAFFRDKSADWELRVQLCTDLESMPIEDASVEWPEERSPFVTVARLSAPVQLTWDDATSPNADQRLTFSPWSGIEAHRPLGSVMRARKATYEASASFRLAKSGCPFHGRMAEEAVVPDSRA